MSEGRDGPPLLASVKDDAQSVTSPSWGRTGKVTPIMNGGVLINLPVPQSRVPAVLSDGTDSSIQSRREGASEFGRTRSLAFARSVYSWLAGEYTVHDSPKKLLRGVLVYTMEHIRFAFVCAALITALVFVHHLAHVQYLDRAEQLGLNTTVRQKNLGDPAMFDTSFREWWVPFYTISALLSAMTTVYVWIAVVSRFRNTRTMIGWLLGWAILYPLFVYGTYTFSHATGTIISHTMFVGPSFIMGTVSIWCVGRATRRYLRFPRFHWYCFCQTAVNAIIFFLYLSWLPSWFLSASTDGERLVIRLIVHPFMFEVAHAANRVAVMMYPRHMSEKRLSVFVVPAYVMSNLLGRFLVSSMDTWWGTFALTALLAMQELLWRTTTAVRDYIYCRIFFGRSDAERMAFNDATRHVKADVLAIDQTAEFFGIFLSPPIVWLYKLQSPGEDGYASTLVLSILMQLFLEVLVDLAPIGLVAFGARKLEKQLQTLEPSGSAIHILQAVVEEKSDESDDAGDGAETPNLGDRLQAQPDKPHTSEAPLPPPTTAWTSDQRVAELKDSSKVVRHETDESSLGQGEGDAQLLRSRDISDGIAGDVPISLCAELKDLQLLTTLKVSVVSMLNAWEMRYKYSDLMVFLQMAAWSAYFLRSFLYPLSVLCAERNDDGDWAYELCAAAS